MNYFKVLKEVKTHKKPFHIARALSAKYYLLLSDKTVVGVTGSVGKTTTTNAIRTALGNEAISTTENLDSIFNIPITVLKSQKFKYLVLEMGVQYPKDMEFNSSIAPSEIVVFTQISPAHTKYLSSLEKIFIEKSKIITKKTKIVIYNYDDKLLREKFSKLNIPSIKYGFSKDCDVRLSVESQNLKNTKINIFYQGEKFNITTSLVGQHQCLSLGAAFAVGTFLSIDKNVLINNLSKTKSATNRFNVVKIANADVIKDIYNSSPLALSNAINFVNLQKHKTKIAILGDMLELGKMSESEHIKIAKLLLNSSFNQVFTYGKEAQKIYSYLSSKNTKLKLTHLEKPFKLEQKKFDKNTLILVKGSHGMHMEDFFSS